MNDPNLTEEADRRRSTRRSLLRGGLVLAPVLALGAWRAQPALAALTRQAPSSSPLVGTASPDQSAPACVLTPQQTEGPYFVDEMLNRSDIRVDPSDGSVTPGVPLRLALNVSQVVDCVATPLAGAYVDVWQCDALGSYSAVRDMSGRFDTSGKQFLRGYQVADDRGAVEFLTIYPGWYQGRTVHIHFKVRTAPEAGASYEFTSQLYFPDELSDQIFSLEPYSAKGPNPTRNERDGIFRSGGSQLMLQPAAQADGSYLASFDVDMDLSAPVSGGQPFRGLASSRGLVRCATNELRGESVPTYLPFPTTPIGLAKRRS